MGNSVDNVDEVKRYKLALAGSNICIWDWMDINKKEQWWSPRFYKMLGYSPTDMEATVDNFKKLLHPEDVDRVFGYLDNHFEGKAPFEVEYRLKTKSGQYKWIRTSAQVEFNEKGEPVRVAGNVVDIHDQKEAEIKLKKERRLLRTIIDNLPASVYVKDLEGRKILANESEYKLWGFDSEEGILGKTDADLSPAGIAVISENEDKEVLETGEPIIKKDAYTEINGQEYVLLASKLPLKDENGDVIGLVGISVDITERKQMETQLRERNKELQKLYDTTNKIYSVIGHDLKTPLTSVLGISNLIIDEVQEDEELVEDLKIIRQSILKMSDLLENLLRWARLQTGDLSINREEFIVADVIENAGELLSLSAEQKGVSVVLNTDESLSVYADQQMIATIVRNFLSNAIKFSSEGDVVKVNQQANSDKWKICVRDEGVGMSQEKQDNLFKDHNHPSEMGTSNEKGSGIGLRLSKELAHLHNGEIMVDSEVGKGAVFTLTVPYYQS